MRQQIRKQLKIAGFNGKVFFRKQTEFGTSDTFGPAIHRRWIDPIYEIEEIIYSSDRDGFNTVVLYLEPLSYYRHKANLENSKHVWDKQQINGLRKGLGYCSNWSTEAKEDLRETMQKTNYNFKISKEQSDFGIGWLRRTQFRLDGKIRAGAFIGIREAKIIQNFKRFEFVGLRFNTSRYQIASAPIYRTYAKDGSYFDYSCSPMGRFAACYEVVT